MGNVESLKQMKEDVTNFPQATIGSLSESAERLVHTGSNLFKTSVTIPETAEDALRIKDDLKTEIRNIKTVALAMDTPNKLLKSLS